MFYRFIQFLIVGLHLIVSSWLFSESSFFTEYIFYIILSFCFFWFGFKYVFTGKVN